MLRVRGAQTPARASEVQEKLNRRAFLRGAVATAALLLPLPALAQDGDYLFDDAWKPRELTTHIVVHHTGGPAHLGPVAVRNYLRQTRGWGMVYHVMVDPQGLVWWCLDPDLHTYHAGCGYAHPQNANNYSVAVTLQGYFMGTVPPDEQLEGARLAIRTLRERYGDLTVIGHKEAYRARTLCPGDRWDDWRHELE